MRRRQHGFVGSYRPIRLVGCGGAVLASVQAVPTLPGAIRLAPLSSLLMARVLRRPRPAREVRRLSDCIPSRQVPRPTHARARSASELEPRRAESGGKTGKGVWRADSGGNAGEGGWRAETGKGVSRAHSGCTTGEGGSSVHERPIPSRRALVFSPLCTGLGCRQCSALPRHDGAVLGQCSTRRDKHRP